MITKDSVKKYVEANPKLVSKKETSLPGVYVLKYKNRCFYDGIWNEVIENSRGAVIDSDYNLIANPFRKIYNFGIEKNAPIINDDEMVTAVRKVNGFMLAVSWYNGDFLFSTTGSVDSDYVKMGKEMFYEHNKNDKEEMKFLTFLLKACNCTVLYECVHPNDPHIVPEKAGVYYLGRRKNNWGAKFDYPKIPSSGGFSLDGGIAPEIIYTTMGEIKDRVKKVKHEGYVIYTDDGRATKIKSPYYLTNKFLARCGKTDRLLSKDIKQNIEEEFYPLIDKIQQNIEFFTLLSEQERLKFTRDCLNSNYYG
jgi:hypothetical protein